MKNLFRNSKIKFGLFAVLATTLVGAGLLQHGSAAVGQMYVSPGSATLQNGSSKTFQIRVHPSAPADSVSATLNYDKAKLQFVSVSGGGSAFNLELVNSGGNGTVNVQRGILGSTVSTDVLVASVTFKALVGSNAAAALDLSGFTLSGGSQSNPSVLDGIVTLTSPATSTPPSSGGGTTTPPSTGGGDDGGSDGSSGGSDGSSGGQSGSGGGSSGDDESSTKPDVKLTRREFKKLILKVTTKQKARYYVLFGTDKEQLKASTKMTKFGTSHDVSLPETLLIPGTTFYYKVVAEDQQGKKVESEVQSTKTKGYTVRVLVLDKFDRPIKNGKVKLFSEPIEGTTDENGYATFSDVAPGRHHVEYVQGDQAYSEPITVQEGRITTAEDGTETADEQQVTATFAAVEFIEAQSSPAIVPAAIASAILLALVGGYLVIKKRRANVFARPQDTQTYGVAQPPVQPGSNGSDELIDKAHGVNRPDPGSVVSPNHDDKDNQ